MEKEPAAYISLLSAFLVLLGAFGIALTEGKIQAIMGLATALLPIVMGLAIRRNVYSPQSAQTLLNLPQGTSMSLANRVLAAEVPVFAGDSAATVITKVERAEDAKAEENK